MYLFDIKHIFWSDKICYPCPVRVYCRHCSAGQPRPGCSGSIVSRPGSGCYISPARPTIKLDIAVLQLLGDRLGAIKNHSEVVPKNLKFTNCRNDRFFFEKKYVSVQELRSSFGHLKSFKILGWIQFCLVGLGLVWLVLVWFGWLGCY